MDYSTLVTLFAAAIVAGTPLLYAALGEVLAERSGIINLGLEGMMLIGALTGFSVTLQTGNNWAGVIAAMFAGCLLSMIHAFLTITLRANQVVSGLALTIFGVGLSNYLGKSMVGIPSPVTFATIKIPLLSDIPYLGDVFFNHDLLVYISYLLVAFIWFYLYKTKYGLYLRAVGENPAAADAAGINVYLVRYIHVGIGGMLAGIGGAYLSLISAPSWLESMTAGRGWIAAALVIFALWNPIRALVGSYIFGCLDILGFRMQAFGISVSPFFLKMLPYIFTIIVLVIVVGGKGKRHVSPPGALGIAYDREER